VSPTSPPPQTVPAGPTLTMSGVMSAIMRRAARRAWSVEPITDAAAMNIPPPLIDLSSLTPLEAAFTTAVRDPLAAIAPWWGQVSRNRLHHRFGS